MGYNCVRLVYSEEQFHKDPLPRVLDEKLEANPALKGKTSKEIFHLTVDAITDAGLMVIFNSHNSDAMWCCSLHDNNGFWWNDDYDADTWLETLTDLAWHYKDEPLVVGNDLRNELRWDWESHPLPPLWGWGTESLDWRKAAIKAARAIHAIDPTILVIVEGLNFATDFTTLFSPIKRNPIR